MSKPIKALVLSFVALTVVVNGALAVINHNDDVTVFDLDATGNGTFDGTLTVGDGRNPNNSHIWLLFGGGGGNTEWIAWDTDFFVVGDGAFFLSDDAYVAGNLQVRTDLIVDVDANIAGDANITGDSTVFGTSETVGNILADADIVFNGGGAMVDPTISAGSGDFIITLGD